MSNAGHDLGGILNFFQLYIGYIGASRAYGMHLEIMDVALFLTNQGVTVYWGHTHRWSRKWRIRVAAPVQAAASSAPVERACAGANRPQVAAAIGGLLGTDGGTRPSPAASAQGSFCVVPLSSAKAATSSRRFSAAKVSAREGVRERMPAKVMAG